MHFTKPFSLIFFATLASHIEVTSGYCCGCPQGWLPPFTTGWCPDGTKCTPFCAYGSCNIFACNCDGGCRSYRRRATVSFANTDLAAADEIEDRFNAADADNDGKLTFMEWAAADENKHADRNVLAAHWAKYDNAGVGYLTKAEAASRVA